MSIENSFSPLYGPPSLTWILVSRKKNPLLSNKIRYILDSQSFFFFFLCGVAGGGGVVISLRLEDKAIKP